MNTLYICVWDRDDSGTTSYFHGFRIGTASALGLVEASQVWFQAAAERWMDANTSQLRCSIVHLVAICCYLLLVDLRDSCNSCVQLLPMPKPSDQVESTCSMRTCPERTERTERTKRTETPKFKQNRFSNCEFLSSQRQDLEEAPVDSLPAREDNCAACAACIMSSWHVMHRIWNIPDTCPEHLSRGQETSANVLQNQVLQVNKTGLSD